MQDINDLEQFHIVRSTFPQEECICLLKDLTGLVTPVSYTEKLAYLKTGGKSYDIITSEEPTDPEQTLQLRELIRYYAPDAAGYTAALGTKLMQAKGPEMVLVSLARGGMPYGVLLKRYFRKVYGVGIPHYVISLVREVGIDENALNYLLQHYASGSLVFIDGWTGSGFLAGQLRKYINEFNRKRGTNIDPQLAAVADIAGICAFSGTREDVFLPGCCLNAAVSGLISSICVSPEYISEQDFHGCIRWDQLKDEDLSLFYVDCISDCFPDPSSVKAALKADGQSPTADVKSDGQDPVAIKEGLKAGGQDPVAIKEGLKPDRQDQKTAVVKLPWPEDWDVRLGIGESFRALFRFPLRCILVRDKDDPCTHYLQKLAESKGIPVEEADIPGYRSAAVLQKL